VEWINDLQEKTVGLDTAPLIYFIEENPAYIETDDIRSFKLYCGTGCPAQGRSQYPNTGCHSDQRSTKR
jgi:hypothetical protein